MSFLRKQESSYGALKGRNNNSRRWSEAACQGVANGEAWEPTEQDVSHLSETPKGQNFKLRTSNYKVCVLQ